jgi:nucleoside-diphosphate-sugar epimerase
VHRTFLGEQRHSDFARTRGNIFPWPAIAFLVEYGTRWLRSFDRETVRIDPHPFVVDHTGADLDDLAGKAVMVAGGAGFVGSAVVRELLRRGSLVVCYDNYLHGHPSHIAGLGDRLVIVHGDVADDWTLYRAIRSNNVEYIIDCVGDTFVPTAYIMPERFFTINVNGTLHLLRAVAALSIKRIIYISTTEVYGEVVGKCNEGTAINPVNTYAVSKAAADRLCHTYFVEHGVPVVIARIFNCYGPRETEPYVIPEIISQLSRGSRVTLGNIKAARDFTYVHDTANALISVLASDVPNGEAVNVGSDTSFSIEWLAQTLSDIMQVKYLEIVSDPARFRRRDIQEFRCDNRKLCTYTDWKPTVSIMDGLRLTVDWFYANGGRWSWESFVDGTTMYR